MSLESFKDDKNLAEIPFLNAVDNESVSVIVFKWDVSALVAAVLFTHWH